jgi:DHA2 family multidrug resistance protein-like MFS transporter
VTRAADAARAGRREWTGLGVLAVPCLLISMDASVLDLAVPHLSAALKPSSTQLLWIVDVYGFLLASSLITMGRLGDRIGRRRLLLIGATTFGGASTLAAFSTSAAMLIGARAALGVAAATLMPSTLSLIRNMFQDPGQRATAIGVWAMSLSLGGAVGPLVGGLMLEWFWWGSVFLLAVPLILVLLVLAPHVLPESRDPHPDRLDWPSALLSLGAVFGVVYGLKQAALHGATAPALATLVVGIGAAAVFLHRQRRLDDPLIDLRLFRLRAFSVPLVANLLGFMTLFGAGFFVSQYLQLVLGQSSLEAGLWMLPMFAMFMIGGLAGPQLVRRLRPVLVMGVGFVVAGVGLSVLTQVDTGSALVVIVAGSVVFALGLAPVFTLATDTSLGAAPPEHAGVASAISETSTELGAALGIAVLGSVGAAVYGARLPAGVPHGATDSLGAAVALSHQLPPARGAQLLDTAQAAFTDGFQVTALVSAGLMAVAATAIVVSLRRRPVAAGRPTEPAERPVPRQEILDAR